MFGFKKKMPSDMRPKLVRLANEALSGLFGLREGDQLIFRTFVLNLVEPNAREILVSRVKEVLASLSHNSDHWSDETRRFDVEISKSSDKFYIIARVIVIALLKTDLCCKIALAYPDDKQARQIALEVVARNCDSLDRIALSQLPTSPLEPTPSYEVCSQLVHVSRLIELSPFERLIRS